MDISRPEGRSGGEAMEKSDDGQDGETLELVRDHVIACIDPALTLRAE